MRLREVWVVLPDTARITVNGSPMAMLSYECDTPHKQRNCGVCPIMDKCHVMRTGCYGIDTDQMVPLSETTSGTVSIQGESWASTEMKGEGLCT
jgi:hypothetical protein